MIIHVQSTNQQMKFKLLNILEFNSTRKRMSVIVQDDRGQIILMCKGADSIILDLLSERSRKSELTNCNQEFVNQYAEEGLRTLFLAKRRLDPQEY